jgi:hypothetical protein
MQTSQYGIQIIEAVDITEQPNDKIAKTLHPLQIDT